MNDRTSKIEAIIAERKARADNISSMQRWMWDAREALAAFREHIATCNLGTPSGNAAAFIAKATAIEAEIGANTAALEKVRSHFAKDTLAVAVVGQAGMGKSTFLQSLTGLSDAQIPASGGRACTSTQSRIENLPVGPGYAEVFYYSRAEMLGILADCYGLLGWQGASFRSLNEFVRDFDERGKPSATALDALWRLLKTYRDNAAALERDVFSPALKSRRIPLENVAASVTYAEGESRPENLGIARVEIHCAFPGEDVGKLSVVDTPGMNAASEDRDKIILEKVLDETADFVLFVGIPAERGISQKEREMFDNCRRCARQVSDAPLDRRAFYIANQAVVRDPKTGEIRRNGADPEYNELWQKDFETGTIPAQRLVRVDAKDAEAVRTEVLDPMIDHLVKTLPELDGAEVAAAKEKADALRVKIAALAKEAAVAFAIGKSIDQDGYRKLRELFDGFFPSFAASLQRTVDAHLPKDDHSGDEGGIRQTPFTKAVADIFTAYREKVVAEFPAERIEFEMNRTAGQGGAAFFNLMGYLRCYVRDSFANLENACRDMVEGAKRDLAGRFKDPLPGGGGMGGVSALLDGDKAPLGGTEFFKALSRLADAAGAPTLAAKFASFAGFELKFSGFIEHKVAKALAPLRQNTYGEFLNEKIDFADAASIGRSLLLLGDTAVNRVAIALVEKSATEPQEAIFSAMEDFVDRTLRQSGVEKEWVALYELLRAEVWPEVFDPSSAANQAALALRERVAALEEIARRQI